MLLAIDIGNTNIVVGVYEGEQMRADWRIATDAHRMADEYAMLLANLFAHARLRFDQVGAVVISSVVPPLISTFEDFSERYLGKRPLVVGPGIRTGVRILYENPKEVGADRIVNALAAFHIYGGPAIVLDFGTATTVDAINKEGDYLGGAIAPGIGIATEALFQHAAKLPRIELVRPKQAIGRNTVASMQSGIIFGYVGLIEGLVTRFKRELGAARVIATGGLAEVMAKETSAIEIVDQELTLTGLRLLYDLNRGFESHSEVGGEQ